MFSVKNIVKIIVHSLQNFSAVWDTLM